MNPNAPQPAQPVSPNPLQPAPADAEAARMDGIEQNTLAQLERDNATVVARMQAMVPADRPLSESDLAALQAYSQQVETYYATFAVKAQELAAGGHQRLVARLNQLIDQQRQTRLVYAQMLADDQKTDAQIANIMATQADDERTAIGTETLASENAEFALTQQYIASINKH